MNPVDRLRWLELVAEKLQGSASGVYVALALLNHRHHKTGRCNPSIPRLAHCTGQSQDTVRRGIARLEAAGLISVKRHQGKHGGRSSDYAFMLTNVTGDTPTPSKSGRGTPSRSGRGTPRKSVPQPLSDLHAGTRRVNPSAAPPLEADGEREESKRLTPEQMEANRKHMAELRAAVLGDRRG